MTQPSRRDLFRYLLALPIAATLDVEKLLWVPKAIITVPAMPKGHRITWDEINAILLREYEPAIKRLLYQPSSLVRWSSEVHPLPEGWKWTE